MRRLLENGTEIYDISAKAKVQKLILTHFYPECDKVDIEKQCRRTYQGPLILARDLMKVCLAAKSTEPL
jgi:ribonuclease BN (tRNA processing enzyme)